VPLKAPLPPQRFGFLPTQEFWELAIYTPIFALSGMGFFFLVEAIADLVGIRFAWWHYALLAFTLSEVWSGIFELFCRRALRRWSRPRALRHARDEVLSGGG
jgi:hypothetical protein